MLEEHPFFVQMVEDLIEFAKYDPELADGIKWLDSEVQRRQKQGEDIDFNGIVFEALYKHDVDSKAKEWLEHKDDI